LTSPDERPLGHGWQLADDVIIAAPGPVSPEATKVDPDLDTLEISVSRVVGSDELVWVSNGWGRDAIEVSEPVPAETYAAY